MAIDRLYAVFATVPRPTAVKGCSHCFDEREHAALMSPVPLRELSAAALRPYAASVLSTVGETADFRYFLPRMFEIACTDDDAWPDFGHMMSRLLIAGWATWAPDEQDSLRSLMHAYWRSVLAAPPGRSSAYNVLEAIGEAEHDLAHYLAAWARAISDPAAAANLLDLMQYSTWPLDHDFYRWNLPVDEQRDQFVDWIHGSELRAALDEAHAITDTAEARQTLNDINELITRFTPSPDAS